MLREAWDRQAEAWVRWARAPGETYWRFHRQSFMPRVPKPSGVTLDLGCGEGRVGRDLRALGHRMISLDASFAMARAAATHPTPAGPVVVGDATALPFAPGSTTCVVAFMSLQDVDDLDAVVDEAARVLAPKGRLLAAITHPLNTAGSFAESEDGDEHFVIEGSWFDERPVVAEAERDGHTMTFHCQHRPLQAYADALWNAGFSLERVLEVTEPDEHDRWHRIPLFLHLVARLDGLPHETRAARGGESAPAPSASGPEWAAVGGGPP